MPGRQFSVRRVRRTRLFPHRAQRPEGLPRRRHRLATPFQLTSTAAISARRATVATSQRPCRARSAASRSTISTCPLAATSPTGRWTRNSRTSSISSMKWGSSALRTSRAPTSPDKPVDPALPVTTGSVGALTEGPGARSSTFQATWRPVLRNNLASDHACCQERNAPGDGEECGSNPSRLGPIYQGVPPPRDRFRLCGSRRPWPG